MFARFAGALVLLCLPVQAHPHVFVDGGVDFAMNDQNDLAALNVTWIYDAFETLYILSSRGISLNAAGALDDADRQEIIRQESDWSDEFDGSAHLSIGGKPVRLERPIEMSADMIDGRLKVTFTRRLKTPINLNQKSAEVAFYEATYYYAFAATYAPQVIDGGGGCNAEVLSFTADEQEAAMQAALAILSKEEPPSFSRVGALFADRIALQCE